MAVFRINKTGNFTVMSNTHLKEKAMSLKAKGLLSVMLSLPDEWDYSIEGLCAICKEKETAINSTLNELKRFKYLTVEKKRGANGLYEYEYSVFEHPQDVQPGVGFPGVDNPGLDVPGVENRGQSITNILNTQELNKEGLSVEGNSVDVNEDNPEKIKKFKPPTVEEVAAYVATRKTKIDPEKFVNHYQSNGWMVGKTKMKDWKAAVRTWERNEREWKKRKEGESNGKVSSDVERIAANIGIRC